MQIMKGNSENCPEMNVDIGTKCAESQ